MEKKSYHWILKLIASRNTGLKVLETIIIADGKPASMLFKDKSHGLSVSYKNCQNLSEFLSKMYKEYQWRQKLRNTGLLICYFISKNERRRIYEKDLRDLISGITTPQLINFIQPARPNSDIYEVIYNFRIEYTTQGYVSSFYKIL